MAHPRIEVERLRQAQARLRRWLERDDQWLSRVRPRVSAWSAAQHLEHVALVEVALYGRVERLLAGDGDGRVLRLAGRAVLLLRRIPRGRGRAPEAVQPRPSADRRHLAEAFAASAAAREALLPRLDEIARGRARAAHLVLGGMNARQWLAYTCVHTRHHERILLDLERQP